MQRFYKLITYLFFPGNMALLGLLSLFWFHGVSLDPEFFLWMVFCYVILPLGGIFILIKSKLIDDLEVFKREQRFKAYAFAIGGAALALFVVFLYKSSAPLFEAAFVWLICIKAALFLLWILTAKWMKISAHMTGTAGFLALCASLVIKNGNGYVWLISALLINVLVYQSRRGLSAHSHKELIAGFCLGFIVTFALTLIL